jgi:hypothetical protein
MTKDEAIEWGGGTQARLAEKLGIGQVAVCGWGEHPPPLRQIQIEMLSGGRLRAEPDVFAGKKRSQVQAA